jgi:hypothetical protein
MVAFPSRLGLVLIGGRGSNSHHGDFPYQLAPLLLEIRLFPGAGY